MAGENYSNIIDMSSIFCPQCCPGPCCIPVCDGTEQPGFGPWLNAVFEVDIPVSSITTGLCNEEQCLSLTGLFIVNELVPPGCVLFNEPSPIEYAVEYISSTYPFGPAEPNCLQPEDFHVRIRFVKDRATGRCFMSVNTEGTGGLWEKELTTDDCNGTATEWTLQPQTCAVGSELCNCDSVGPITVRRTN